MASKRIPGSTDLTGSLSKSGGSSDFPGSAELEKISDFLGTLQNAIDGITNLSQS